MKCIIIVFNIIFGLVGVAFLGAGLYVKYGADDVLEQALNASFSSLENMLGDFGTSGSDDSQSVDLGELVEFLSPVITVLIVFGAFLLLMVILASVGVCCKVKIVLWLYAIIITILLIIQIVLIILFFTGALNGTIRNEMLITIKKEYVASDAYDIYSVMWNVLNQKYECCGVTDYEDFHGAEKWNRTRVINPNGVPVVVYLDTPFSCCKPDSSDYHCAETPNDQNNYYKTSCYDKIWAAIETVKPMTIGALAVVLILQALCVIAAIVIVRQMSKDEDFA